MRWTYGSIAIAFIVMVVGFNVILLLFNYLIGGIENIIIAEPENPAIKTIFNGVKEIYLLLKKLLTTPQGLMITLAVTLILMAYDVEKQY